MIRNYFTTAYRILFRNKVFSLINIFGLSIALTSVLIIFLFITHELSFDKYHSNYDRIYRIVNRELKNDKENFDETVPVPLSSALRTDLNGHENVTQIYFSHEQLIRVKEDKFLQDGLLFADTNFIKVFDVEFISGNPLELKNPNTIFLTEVLAVKYFGTAVNALNQEIILMDSVSFNIVGILKDPPKNTHIPYKAIISFNSISDAFFSFEYDNWGTSISGFRTYLTLKANVSEKNINDQIKNIVKKNNPDDDNLDNNIYYLQSLSKVHFDDRFGSFEGAYNTSIRFIWIFTSVGLFILLIAFINFTNLSIVQAIKRAKEVGIRKVLGADRFKLIKQFFGETFLLILIAEIIALILTEVVINKINSILGNNMELELYRDFSILLFLFIVLISVTFLSGIYPATVLSRYNPIRALRNNMKLGRNKSFSLHNILVVFQFFISQILIVSAIVISLQIDFFMNKDLGFDKENIILVNLPQNQAKKAETLIDLIKQNPNVQKVSMGIGAPLSGSNINSSIQLLDDPEKNYSANIKAVDTSYYDLFDFQLIAGNWYKKPNTTDTSFNIVINKTLVQTIGIEDPIDAIGQYLKVFGYIHAEIVGVVDDFHSSTLHRDFSPVIFAPIDQFYYTILIKTNGKAYSDLQLFMENSWNEVFPEYIYSYKFLEDTINERYSSEQRIFDIIKLFTIIAILIACLGLYGLVSFMLVQRTKEIGIRKALGASISSLIILVSKQFLKLVLISSVFAWPLAFYLMKNWLNNYAFKIDLNIWIFIISGIMLIIITFITIFYQSIKASGKNPVDSLKYE
ncbi:MAG: FtsX-like permease family protein [Bacteroidales bacterium]|nr:FtsX-like permease family protein [Bacteroidales bacterium]